MTVQELKDFVENIIDDTIGSDLFIDLVNDMKDEVEDDREWEILKKIDSSKNALASDTYLTMKDLPTDFRTPMNKIHVGTELEYKPVPFEQRYLYKNSSRLFYIDFANSQFAIIGAPGSTETIYMPYIHLTDEVTALTDDLDTVWPFPSRFQKRLGYDIAGFYTAGVDYDDIYARMSPEHKLMANRKRKQMENWNNKLALTAMDYSSDEFNNHGAGYGFDNCIGNL